MAPFKLRIKLENSSPPVERKILVPQDINLLQLHLLIQEAMGWENQHLFEFCEFRGRKQTWRAGLKVEFDDESVDPVDEVLLAEIKENDIKDFYYNYDFGDDWWHKITFQKPTKKDSSAFKGIPICVEAINACPPEDVGGVWGYESFLEAIRDPKHPEREDYRQWMGLEPDEQYDPTEFDLNGTNLILKKLFLSKKWNETLDDFFEED